MCLHVFAKHVDIGAWSNIYLVSQVHEFAAKFSQFIDDLPMQNRLPAWWPAVDDISKIGLLPDCSKMEEIIFMDFYNSGRLEEPSRVSRKAASGMLEEPSQVSRKAASGMLEEPSQVSRKAASGLPPVLVCDFIPKRLSNSMPIVMQVEIRSLLHRLQYSKTSSPQVLRPPCKIRKTDDMDEDVVCFAAKSEIPTKCPFAELVRDQMQSAPVGQQPLVHNFVRMSEMDDLYE
jgi:hypothetical protein